jgi:hypothetical protein
MSVIKIVTEPEQLRALLPPVVATWLHDYCLQTGYTKSEVIRASLEGYLDKQILEGKFLPSHSALEISTATRDAAVKGKQSKRGQKTLTAEEVVAEEAERAEMEAGGNGILDKEDI